MLQNANANSTTGSGKLIILYRQCLHIVCRYNDIRWSLYSGGNLILTQIFNDVNCRPGIVHIFKTVSDCFAHNN